ncbi:heparinase II/III family protein [Chitinophaga sp. MM2321]|uniref:heparinase II/III family protein n=1 Tax=Chitinophaga sp. MM2321 TaxID=3137178 RepID=UPI0032D588DD
MRKIYFTSKSAEHGFPAVKTVLLFVAFICQTLVLVAQKAPFPIRAVDEQQVREIESLLPDNPTGLGEPYNKRAVWDKLLQSGKYDRFLLQMEHYSFPPFSKEDYFSLSDGSASSSARGLNMMRKRAEGLSKATWAECLENKNRYTKMVEEGLRSILNQKSWVSPRSDYGFKNYNGIAYSVELTSSLYAHTIAQTLYLMGDKINPRLRTDAIDALQKRIFEPVLEKIKTRNTENENNFLVATNNWNHVCLAGLVGAALATIEDKHERAVFVAIGAYYANNGLTGFGSDGYCTEGIGYYNYGFGHYILLRECIWEATGGKIDLLASPKVQKIARYGPDLQIINGVYPAISDSHEGAKPDSSMLTYLSRNLGMGLMPYDGLTYEGKTDNICNNIMMVFPNSASLSKPQPQKHPQQLLRSFFDKTGVLISRPVAGSSCMIGVAFKGGNNAESHNHNDVGSFTIVQANQIMVGDPGAIAYTANIFTPKYRYTYKTVGSFGHPVPLVAGKEQQAGAEAKSATVHTAFSPEKDEITLDIAPAYNVPELKTLQRTMEYSRKQKGNITFTDRFEYTDPQMFETALSTRAQWEQTSPNTLLLTRANQKMIVRFSSTGNSLVVRSEEISEGGTPYTRIGIAIKGPVRSGSIRISYEPLN